VPKYSSFMESSSSNASRPVLGGSSSFMVSSNSPSSPASVRPLGSPSSSFVSSPSSSANSSPSSQRSQDAKSSLMSAVNGELEICAMVCSFSLFSQLHPFFPQLD